MTNAETLLIDLAKTSEEFCYYLSHLSDIMSDEILKNCFNDKGKFHYTVIKLDIKDVIKSIDKIMSTCGRHLLTSPEMLDFLRAIYKVIEKNYTLRFKDIHCPIKDLELRVLINSLFDGIAIVAPPDFSESVKRVFDAYGISQF